MPMIAAVAGPAARMVRSMVSRPKREMEIGSGGKAGSATIANWPNSPARNAGSTSPTVSVVTSSVSRRTDTIRAVANEPGVAAIGLGSCGLGARRERRGDGEQLLPDVDADRAPGDAAAAATQPNVPNWSTQVANLWVSHWR